MATMTMMATMTKGKIEKDWFDMFLVSFLSPSLLDERDVQKNEPTKDL